MAEIIQSKKALAVNPLKVSQPVGASLAFLGLARSLPLMHGSQGCTAFGKVFFVRHFREPIPLQTTAMDQVSTIMGADENVVEALRTLSDKNRPDVIGLVTTGLSETQGTDIRRAIKDFRAAHPEFDYALVAAGDSQYVLARELLESVRELFGWADATVLAEVKGAALEGLAARHPFYDRPSPLVTADYVTLDAGTGLVHTAPGHGREDYDTGLRNGLDILSPMDDAGRFLDVVPYFAGLTVWEANPKVIEKLKEVGHLLAERR